MDTPLVASPSDQCPPSPPPPPLALLQDDPHVLDQARKRLHKKSRFSRLFSRRSSSRLRPQQSDDSLQDTPGLQVFDTDNTPIHLDNTALAAEDVYTDRYEWAVLYENQRGITIFSIPYYSSLSLLPSDPSPFTLPSASLKRSKQPPITLDSYPLPDGNWHWVSRCWMIDMRTDSGEVQHDGFEYNWMFRRHNWRAQIGSFNAGGWVRRRRWIRLMVRPAKPRKDDTDISVLTPSTAASSRSSDKRRHRHSIASSFPPSVFTQRTDMTDAWAKIDPDEVWMGDTAMDWLRCRQLMKQFGRDGRKLELWKLWLGCHHPEHKQKFLEPDDKGKRREKQWTEDDEPLPSEIAAADILSREYVAIAPRELVIALLRVHGQELLHLFIFPESRVQFLKLLAQADLLSELNVGLGIGFGSTEIDFWSYASGLGESVGSTPKDKGSVPQNEKTSTLE
ncbi:Meiotically up-regulated gene 65 protein [Psilocybe cubensis]|uniref:Meiotically up-regulated gene 65 protein n=2 Tax=Psilocybe cubensis TaxID=181762 RepID=A0ACB8HGW9_PSICU|nr:Meiotically up-regulated gene 65 protein [Psilocybe cubensis]KAH9486929.1 Meiotically up-regulated gene 65 protein [Psilocybe cubensis]